MLPSPPPSRNRPLPPRQRLALLLGVSLLTHAALLSPWLDDSRQTQRIGADEVGELRVALESRATGARAPRRPEPPAPTMAPTLSQPATPDVASQDSAGANAGASVGPDSRSQHAQAQLRFALARYFTYPPLARRQGWQGEVILGLTLEADGHMKNLQVARSSGYAVLDAAALASLRRVARLPDADRWMAGDSVDVRLPVVYQLRDQ